MFLADTAAWVLVLAGVALALPVGVLVLEIAASFLPPPAPPAARHRPSVAVLIPAHDEALGIVEMIEGILPQLAADDRLVVVADNCTDATAELAKRAGAEVVERVEPDRRGKAFALDYGLERLAGSPPEVVVIVDADCRLAAGGLDRLAAIAAATGRPVQAQYKLEPPEGIGSTYLQVANFAFVVKTFCRPLGLLRLGLPSPLLGTGMAFPWPVIRQAELGSSEIVEDLVLGLELTRSGHPPLFCPEIVVRSSFPVSNEGQQSQRTRWETGHLNVITKRLPGLLLQAIRTRNIPLFALAVDAAVPPLAFFTIVLAGYAVLTLLLLVATGQSAPAVLSTIILAAFFSSIVLAWFRAGRDLVPFKVLALAPYYILSKLGLYGRVLAGRKIGWVRSRRD